MNDLTVGNNEAIAITLIYTRVIGQQTRSYDKGMKKYHKQKYIWDK